MNPTTDKAKGLQHFINEQRNTPHESSFHMMKAAAFAYEAYINATYRVSIEKQQAQNFTADRTFDNPDANHTGGTLLHSDSPLNNPHPELSDEWQKFNDSVHSESLEARAKEYAVEVYGNYNAQTINNFITGYSEGRAAGAKKWEKEIVEVIRRFIKTNKLGGVYILGSEVERLIKSIESKL